MHERTWARRSAGRSIAGMALAERDFGDGDGKLQGNVAHMSERRIEAALREIGGRHLLRERPRGGEEHLVGDALRARPRPRRGRRPGKM